MGKKRRGHRKARADESPVNDIEEQLRRQRLKKEQQQLQQQQEVVTKTPLDHDAAAQKQNAPPDTMGAYMYDPDRNAYFPKEFFKNRHYQPADDRGERSSSTGCPDAVASTPARARTFPLLPLIGSRLEESVSNKCLWHRPAILSYLAEQCQRPSDRKTILSRWNGRLRLESLDVQSVPDACIHDVLPNGSYRCASLNLENYAPWQRTFDVLQPRGDELHHQRHRLPTFVSVGKQGGNVSGGEHIKALPISVDNGHEYGSTTTTTAQSYGHLRFSEHDTEFQLNGDSFVWTDGHMNDFAVLPFRNSVVLGGSRGILLFYNYESTLHIPRDKVSQSDILCVETDVSSTGSTIYCGHRDGGVTLRDIRAPRHPDDRRMVSANSSFGSVVQMQLLSDQRPDQVLIRGCGGSSGSHRTSLRLLDLRQLGRLDQQKSSSLRGSAVVHEMMLPMELGSTFGATPCKGMATDPLRSIAIVPYTNMDHQGCFGMWSIDTGEFVGSKSVLSSDSHISTGSAEILELCSQITRAWTFKKQGLLGRDRRSRNAATVVPGSFGLWFEWGRHGIHHVVFDDANGRFTAVPRSGQQMT